MPEEIVLYEGQLTTTSTLAFTANTGQQVQVVGVSLVNVTGSAATARIDRVPSAGTDAATEEVYNGSVSANATVELPTGGEGIVVQLRPGDELYVSSGSATAIDCTINGLSEPI